ncbi:MAG: peptide chain release factor N(5)-glutamine methyltransferase [Rhodocyclaceae bacterium]|nr:peptide chain release factor N(5)-glutamine methyltransferase [Rhodocyclaceae bacterium]
MTEVPLSLGQALGWAREQIDGVDARALLCHVAECSHATLSGFPERMLTHPQARTFERLVERRLIGEPIAYLVGAREFYSRRFRVGAGVLIPRPETEVLVEEALRRVAGREQLRVLDLGTGSGILAITLALELGARAESVVAVDRSAEALGYAVWNAGALGARVDFREGDWLAGLEGYQFDLVVSNPPYVADGDPHLARGDLRFEPVSALASGPAGLDDIRLIARSLGPHLAAGAWVLIEHGWDQAADVRAILASAGLAQVGSADDLAGISRVSFGRRRIDGTSAIAVD